MEKQIELYDYQKYLIDSFSKTDENWIIASSRQVGISTMFDAYVKQNPHLTFSWIKPRHKSNFNYHNCVKLSFNKKDIFHHKFDSEAFFEPCFNTDVVILEDAAFYDLRSVLGVLLTRCCTQNKIIIHSCVNYKNDFFYKMFEDPTLYMKNIRKQQIHWSLCPHYNEGYFDREHKMTQGLVNWMKCITKEEADAEVEMIPKIDKQLKQSLERGYLITK